MKTARVGIAFLFATCLAVLAACGGGNGADELERALQSVTENDLAIMVLPQEDLGEEFADLEIDEDSGFVDNEQAADGTIDPPDTADDLEQAGRINGYELGYEAPDWFSVLEAGQGVIAVDTEVVLFEDGPAASEFLAKQVDDSLRLEGEEIQTGITLEEVETFQVVGLADEAVGQRRRISFGDAQMYGTVVGFRLDRLLGSAAIVRADDANVNSQVEAIARALEQRIEGVLLGDIGGMPVPVPQAEEEATVAPPSEGGPDLAAMALSLDDLPDGVSIDHEGYVEDEDTVASYEREFDLGLVSIGSSRLMSLESEVDLYENAAEASSALTGFEFIATSESAGDLLAPVISEAAGFEVTNVRLEPVPTVGLEHDSVGFRVSFDMALGRYEMIGIFIRVDRAVGSVSLMGLAGKVDSTDAVPLAEAMAARMASAMAEEGPPAPAATPTLTISWLEHIPTPPPFGAPSAPASQFPADITSYRYTMETSMEAPELMEELMQELEGATEEEEGLGGALVQLFGGFLMAFTQGATVEGAYVAPDRSWDKMTLGGKPFAEVIQIGDRSWFRMGEMDWTESGAELPSQEEGVTSQISVTVSSPTELLCEGSPVELMSTVPGLRTEKETINGIKAVHYHIDEADLRLLAALFGEGEGAEEMPESATGTMDVWLAEDGNWPVRVEGEVSYTDEEGRSITFDVCMEIKDINDPDIEIEPPI